MDIRCPICADPVEIDYLHDIADDTGTTFKKVYSQFVSQGCAALNNGRRPSYCQRTDHGTLVSAMMDIFGDDIDGLAAIFEDIEYAGGFS